MTGSNNGSESSEQTLLGDLNDHEKGSFHSQHSAPPQRSPVSIPDKSLVQSSLRSAPSRSTSRKNSTLHALALSLVASVDSGLVSRKDPSASWGTKTSQNGRRDKISSQSPSTSLQKVSQQTSYQQVPPGMKRQSRHQHDPRCLKQSSSRTLLGALTLLTGKEKPKLPPAKLGQDKTGKGSSTRQGHRQKCQKRREVEPEPHIEGSIHSDFQADRTTEVFASIVDIPVEEHPAEDFLGSTNPNFSGDTALAMHAANPAVTQIAEHDDSKVDNRGDSQLVVDDTSSRFSFGSKMPSVIRPRRRHSAYGSLPPRVDPSTGPIPGSRRDSWNGSGIAKHSDAHHSQQRSAMSLFSAYRHQAGPIYASSTTAVFAGVKAGETSPPPSIVSSHILVEREVNHDVSTPALVENKDRVSDYAEDISLNQQETDAGKLEKMAKVPEEESCILEHGRADKVRRKDTKVGGKEPNTKCKEKQQGNRWVRRRRKSNQVDAQVASEKPQNHKHSPGKSGRRARAPIDGHGNTSVNQSSHKMLITNRGVK
ncbi:hypothetical protein QFC21_003503 [Naganishia friedmannii]|uniref:Uncharacterized protein n=1 Tax=Naganishia friedmannii TaxID=89922 RepID=A0ACC2VM19_9TREE|nr:hypothetical protein QFC21_003503 [Naganishia friedmannii]